MREQRGSMGEQGGSTGEQKDEMGCSAGAERRDLGQREITLKPTFGDSIYRYI